MKYFFAKGGQLFAVCFVLALAAGCQKGEEVLERATAVSPTDPPLAYLEENEQLSGGQATVFDTTPNAFSQPIPGLEREQELLFFVGNSFFNQNWVMAPASTTARDGLGPFFNARSCASCHFKDGRGRAPEFAGEMPTGFLLRLSVPGSDFHGDALPEPTYGGQLQDQAITDFRAEGGISIVYEEMPFTFPDGETVMLRQPSYAVTDLAYGDLHPETLTSPRVANQMIGMGLLEAVPEETILALADPTDQNGDGVSGRPNVVWDAYNNQMAIGRFGWKANQPTVLQQVAGAFLGDIGITTPLFALENCQDVVADCATAVNGGSPEIDPDDFLKVVLYSSSLAVPARRGWDDPQVLAGKKIFNEIGCATCHTPLLTTGIHPTIPALSQQTIRPYTDLLLHDMGEGLADGRPDFQATGSEWRTPPLWGIGLFETVNGHTNYLHDGRARNLTEAILWHGGEAAQVRDNFANLTPAERDALLRFLNSL
ncbi:MAG: c-type cytochrome [Ardenticatenaceae bacterium]|nr:c-type cytochrome [Ardenticatenaceae bacterium]